MAIFNSYVSSPEGTVEIGRMTFPKNQFWEDDPWPAVKIRASHLEIASKEFSSFNAQKLKRLGLSQKLFQLDTSPDQEFCLCRAFQSWLHLRSWCDVGWNTNRWLVCPPETETRNWWTWGIHCTPNLQGTRFQKPTDVRVWNFMRRPQEDA